MNKKRLSSLLCSILAFVLAFSTLSACGKPTGEQADPNKTQLYISHYNGGVGKAWLDKIETDFQNAYADWENPTDESKVGVQIIVNNHKNEGQTLADDLLGNRDEIFFTDKSAYYDMLSGNKLLDISSVLTDVNTDGKTILSKLTDQQKAYYSYGDSENYFALPHYESFGGITYNVNLWNQQNLYYAKGYCPSEYSAFVQSENDDAVDPANKPEGYDDSDPETWVYVNVEGVENYFDPDNPTTYGRSAGPDGKYGTDDDGLPATYDEFFALCDHMVDYKQTTPFIWSGKLGQYYFKYILNALVADHDGKEMVELSYNFNGTADKLITSVGEDGTLKYEYNVPITTENGYKTFFTEGTYYALTFIEKLLSDPDYYSDNLEAEGTHYHINAQREFVLSQFDKAKYNKADNKYIAMLIEGNYWENEARDAGVFDRLSSYGKTTDDVSYANLPMPKANEKYIGKTTTVMEYQQNIAFIKSNISSDKVELAKDFLKFCYTDEKLQEFTSITGVTKGLNYSLDGVDGTGLTDYANSLIDMKKNGEMAYMVSGNSAFTDHQSYFEFRFATKSYTYVLEAMKDHNWSAKRVFDGIMSYRTKDSWDTNILGLK